MEKLLLIFLVCLSFAHMGTCLRCYVCTSANGTAICSDHFDLSKNKELDHECDLEDSVCVKEKSHSSGFHDSIHRGCFHKDYCENMKTSKFCETCKKDLCNASSILVPSFVILAAFILKSCL